MKTGPLNESELEWLDDILTKYSTDHAILDVAELDGLLTAVLSSPQELSLIHICSLRSFCCNNKK